MKKLWIVGIMVSMMCIVLSACSGAASWDPQEDCLYIRKDGSVESALVDQADIDLSGATSDQLKTFIQTEVDDYNTNAGTENAVSINDVKIKDGTMKVVYNYTDPSYVIGWAQYSQDDSVKISSISVQDKTVTVEGQATIYFEGKVDTSSEGVTVDGNKVTTPAEGTSTITYK